MSTDASDPVVGVFMGLEKSSYEYVAWLIAPYKADFTIEIGSLLLIHNVRDSIVSRVTDYSPRGEFTSIMGEKWLNDIAAEEMVDEIGHDIKRSKISYKVRIKVLGSLSDNGFSPGMRRIPQITSKVYLPGRETVRRIIGSAMQEQSGGVHVGDYSLDPDIGIMFDQRELNSKRTFIFARAGYGKSNLMKVICGEWEPQNGGLLIFDQEGEYAITDRKDRPGIMDRRPALLVTNQAVPPDIKNVNRRLNINLAELPPGLVVPFMVSPSKHETVFFAKLMSMNRKSWRELVMLLHEKRWNAGYGEVSKIVLGLGDSNNASSMSGEIDVKPILNNLVPHISKIHDPSSNTIRIVKEALRQGKVVIFDISRTDSHTARLISSIIIKDIFDENKDNFIKAAGEDLINATFVLEEAHAVLSDSRYSPAPSAFVDLAKEGRKYGLGGIFITQQPGSIPSEIISQGDNFFVFHLLSRKDLDSLSEVNAHYSNDIVTQILSEPIRGKSYMWTSHQPFVIPVNVVNFEDPGVTRPHQSAQIQNQDDILGNITRQIHNEISDPAYASILEKLERIENNADIPEKRKAMQLFRVLDDAEKSYLRERGGIKSGDTGEFAVTYPYYYRIRDDWQAVNGGDAA